ncbi:hypothetical protein T484DRAFT_1757364, partial [Baffinella frigidus]
LQPVGALAPLPVPLACGAAVCASNGTFAGQSEIAPTSVKKPPKKPLANRSKARSRAKPSERTDKYVPDSFGHKIVQEMPRFARGSQSILEFGAYLQDEFGKGFATGMIGDILSGLKNYVVQKLIHINALLIHLSHEPVVDPRSGSAEQFIVVPVLMEDEAPELGGLKVMLRVGRNFHVKDPLAFNRAFREMQGSLFTYPRKGVPHGIKGVTDVFDIVGLGLPVGCVTYTAQKWRGPPSTDPTKCNLSGDAFVLMEPAPHRVTDGLYLIKYEYTEGRAFGKKAPKSFKKAPKSWHACDGMDEVLAPRGACDGMDEVQTAGECGLDEREGMMLGEMSAPHTFHRDSLPLYLGSFEGQGMSTG